ncbi:FHA domain-containing protein [Solimicrobium silvestre]|uniref:FHA domain n=1 Tax=Solimicrobium silvestre TaxID=2099400 RepID=A0A2S9GSX9_9BURK|nr:FHA domain-containing protein [Solimicrobium silvestre]PRC90832.1 FHA domain [Solimicrobium silvestre]
MQASPASAPASKSGGASNSSAVTANSVEKCPECMTLRPAGARFCEACRYDFVSRSSFSSLAAAAQTTSAQVPVAVAPSLDCAAPDTAQVLASTSTVADSVAAAANTFVSAQRLLLRVIVDPLLYTDPDPDLPCPTDRPEKIFHLDLNENTLGRQFEGNGVHPEIVVHDPSISRRHLKFVRGKNGEYSVLELGSANGTEFNSKTLEPGVVTALNPGDQITLGMWTRISVEAR